MTRPRLPFAFPRATLDVTLSVLAALVAVTTLASPLARDHGGPFLAAQALLRHGAGPYASTLDASPPGLHLVYLLGMLVVGAKPEAVRLGDLVAAAALVAAASRLAHAAGTRRPVGVVGVAAVTTTLFYFGLHGFWDTGRGQLPAAALVAFAYVVTRERPGRRPRWWLGGVLLGAASTIVPAALLFGAHPLAVALARGRGTARVSSTAAFVCGAACPWLLLGIGLGLLGDWDSADRAREVGACWRPLIEPLHWSDDGRELIGAFAELGRLPALVLASALASAAAAVARARRVPSGVALALVASALAPFVYLANAPPRYLDVRLLLGLPVVLAAAAATEAASRGLGRLTAPVVLVLTSWVLASFWVTPAYAPAARAVRATYTLWRTGSTPDSRTLHAKAYVVEALGYEAVHDRVVAEVIKYRSSPRDRLLVRGNERQIHALANREPPGPVAWTTPLFAEGCAAHASGWAELDARAIASAPRHVVALDVPAGPDSPSWFEARGYVRVERFGFLWLLERP